MLFYQHSIVKPNDLSKVNIAFMTANGIASIVFSIFVIAAIYYQISHDPIIASYKTLTQ
jgi:4-hydroxybenzoate polyprenyltransferase